MQLEWVVIYVCRTRKRDHFGWNIILRKLGSKFIDVILLQNFNSECNVLAGYIAIEKMATCLD